jgi:hypothetical protein
MQYVDSAFDSTLRNPEKPILLGIVPARAELGYGWIETGANFEWREDSHISNFRLLGKAAFAHRQRTVSSVLLIEHPRDRGNGLIADRHDCERSSQRVRVH